MPREFVVIAPRTIEYREYVEPPLLPNEVRIRTLISGIKTGTELSLYRGTTPFLHHAFDQSSRLFMPVEGSPLYPCNLGSWAAGEVVEVGSAVTLLHVGDRVHGGMAHRPTHVKPERAVYRAAPGVPLETALFVDPALFALQAVHDAEIKVGDRVAIFGMGAIGLLAVQIARMDGASFIVAVDGLESRRQIARQFGADATIDPSECDAGLAIKDLTGGRGVDVAIEISGAIAALQQALRCAHREGLVVTASYYKDTGPLQLGAEWHHNRLTMRSSMAVWGCAHRRAPMWDLARIERTAIDLLERGKLDTNGLITHRFPYEEAPAAYELLETHFERTVKVALTYSED